MNGFFRPPRTRSEQRLFETQAQAEAAIAELEDVLERGRLLLRRSEELVASLRATLE